MNEKYFENKDDTFREFANSMIHYPDSEVKCVSNLIKKSLIKQKERFKYHGIRVESEIIPSDKKTELQDYSKTFGYYVTNNNQTFKNELQANECLKITKFYKNNKLIKKLKFDNILYANVTKVNDTKNVEHHSYNCPNCGNLIMIKELLNGCHYCGSKFLLSDLYPVVTNYYHLKNTLSSRKVDKVVNKTITRVSLIIAAILTTLICIYLLFKENSIEQFGIVLSLIMAPFIFCGIFFLSYFHVALFTGFYILVSAISGAFYKEPVNTMSTKTEIENFMKKYDPNFTYFLFQGKITSMFKEIIFSDNPRSLPIYNSNVNCNFTNILESDYRGGLKINSMIEKDGYIYIDLMIYTYDTIIQGNNIFKTKNKYRAVVSRKSSVISTSDFRIQSINCKNCGAPIDIENNNKCAYCDCNYELKDYEFVFESLNLE